MSNKKLVTEIVGLFRSREKFSTTYPIVLFFFSRPFHKKFKFLENCPNDFDEILHSHSTPKGTPGPPACSKALKSYDWNVRNIAKISPKMAKKQSFFNVFSILSKVFIRFERNFLQSFYTILWSFMCNFINFVWLGCQKHSQNYPKMAKSSCFSTFDFRKNCPYDLYEILYNPFTLYYGPLCVISSNSYCWDVSNIAEINPKTAEKQQFFDFFKFLLNCPYYSNKNFYSHFLHHSMVYVCNFKNIV